VSGYVRIHRSLIGHPAFRNDAEAMAFAWLVAKAAWQPIRVRYKDRIVNLVRGQLAVSVRDFANAMDRDKGWCERLLKRLKNEAMIETRNETGVNIITISNYAEYQSRGLRKETLDETPPKTGARQAQDTEQEREEREEGKLSSNDDSSSGDEPALAVDEVFKGYQRLAKDLGLNIPRDLTPERRQLIRFRIGQYPLEDFQTVFAKCRDSPFLRGDKGRTPLKFDWIFKKANFQKTLEGNYD
jgi:hypothetical protein